MVEINPSDYILVKDKDSPLYLSKQRTLQSNNWEQQIRKLQDRKGYMSEIRDFLDLRDLLDSQKRVYDGKGKLVSTDEKARLLDEMVAVRDPWRAEYFGNRFFNYNGIWYIESRFRVIGNETIPLLKKEVHPKVMEDDWTSFKYFDEDGLATKLNGKEVYYWCPRNGTVARFDADLDRAYLNCDRDPSDSDAELGVREARENFEV